MAVVSDDEDSARWVGCLLLRQRRSQSHDVRVGERIMEKKVVKSGKKNH